MTSPELQLRPEVERDVDEAVRWCADRAPALASRFLRELDEVYARILKGPLQFPIAYKDGRRALLDRFPYGVYFATGQGKVDVVAVMNLRQHPDTWRLSDR